MNKIPDELISQADSVSILSVLESQGEHIFRDGKEYRWKEHDSVTIDPDKNVWCQHSTGKGGGVISLLRTFFGLSFRDAVAFLSLPNNQCRQRDRNNSSVSLSLATPTNMSYSTCRTLGRSLRTSSPHSSPQVTFMRNHTAVTITVSLSDGIRQESHVLQPGEPLLVDSGETSQAVTNTSVSATSQTVQICTSLKQQ